MPRCSREISTEASLPLILRPAHLLGSLQMTPLSIESLGQSFMIAGVSRSQTDGRAQLCESFVQLALINQHFAKSLIARRKVRVDSHGSAKCICALGNHLLMKVGHAEIKCCRKVGGIQLQGPLQVLNCFIIIAQSSVGESQIEDRQHVVGTELQRS